MNEFADVQQNQEDFEFFGLSSPTSERNGHDLLMKNKSNKVVPISQNIPSDGVISTSYESPKKAQRIASSSSSDLTSDSDSDDSDEEED